MADDIRFLEDHQLRYLKLNKETGLQAHGLFVGNGPNAVEVAVAKAEVEPTTGVLRQVWKDRKASRASPLLLVVLRPGGVTVCGATGENPPLYVAEDVEVVERICREALCLTDRHSAVHFLAQALPALETPLAGLTNHGLVALHELEQGVPDRPDWNDAGRKAEAVRGTQAEKLLEALGFTIKKLDSNTKLLMDGKRRVALAVLVEEGESPEASSKRLNDRSPVSFAFARADNENLRWVILVQGNRVRLYSTSMEDGVGRRGRTETYIECQTSLLSRQNLPYLWLLFSAEAIAPEGSLMDILGNSRRFAGDLAESLRERIYNAVVPTLARGVANAKKMKTPSATQLELAYEMALTILFRLLFIAYAEDRDLLPYSSNEAYRARSLKRKAQELVELVATGKPIAEGSSSHWDEVSLLWDAVNKGNSEWGVPAYNGGLFTDDEGVSMVGSELARISLSNEVFELALRELLVIETTEGVPGAVDFRSLGVREFGTIYEGLLESELAVASTNLTINNRGAYLPTTANDDVEVEKGEIYLHNRSGTRKSSGSYYTKPFAVEYLLDGALEPALDEHLDRIRSMDETDAAEAFFNFRVADIAMGSGHFLIAAIDRIEKRMGDFLADNPIPGVIGELSALRQAARKELGDLAESANIEDSQLLRRIIARRCIYGVDLNGLAVQLTRLAVWIHTFVPGLPLSMLDHNLVCGNALVGIGTIDEIRRRLEEASLPLLEVNAEALLGNAAEPLRRIANSRDATLDDIARARDAIEEAHNAIGTTKDLFDLVTAQSVSDDAGISGYPFSEWERQKESRQTKELAQLARKELEDLGVFHFPIAFPEVYLAHPPGFNVVLGNPPWEKATIEEHAFWARHMPGLRARRLSNEQRSKLRKERPDLVAQLEAEQKRKARERDSLTKGGIPG